MLLRIHVGVGSALLLCAWSCQAWATDICTLYSSLPEPASTDSPSHPSHAGDFTLTLPAPIAWAYHLEGPGDMRREAVNTYLTMMKLAGAPVPDPDFAVGGMPGTYKRSYFHMFTRATAAILVFDVALFGTMLAMPRKSMKWQPDFVQDAVHNLGKHIISAPVWDHDNWRLNYIGHPVAGSIYYNAVRSQGGTILQSFVFAFAASTFWEYTIEATAEPASTQDLFVTPVGGAILGELINQITVQMKKNGTSFLEGIAITILNPTHVLMAGYH